MESELKSAMARMGQKRAPRTSPDINLDMFDEFLRTPDPDDYRDVLKVAKEMYKWADEESSR